MNTDEAIEFIEQEFRIASAVQFHERSRNFLSVLEQLQRLKDLEK